MRIAFDHQAFNWQSYGGVSRYYSKLADALLSLEQNVAIFAGAHRNNYLSSLPNDVVKGIKLSGYPPKMGRLFLAANHYWANRKIIQWQPDIIHETYYSFMSSPKKTAPRVVTVYDMIHELFPEMFGNNRITQWKKNAFARADHIISISNSTKHDLVKFFDVDPGKVSVVHLGTEVPKPSVNDINASSLEKPFLLYVGGRDGYKNFVAFLQAVASSERLSAEFDIVAFGGGEFSADELRVIKSLKFGQNQVRQLAGTDKVLSELYSNASALIYPSLYEGFGLPPLEAMANGCPVISSNASSMPEVIANAGEFFDPNSNEEIATAIENVVFSLSRTTELKLNGLERVKTFSWQKCAQETLEIYKVLAG